MKKENEDILNSIIDEERETANSTIVNEENDDLKVCGEENELDDFALIEQEEKNNKSSKKERKAKIKKLVSLIIPSIAIISGIAVGLYFGNQFFSTKYDPNAFDQNSLEDDQTVLMKRFDNLNSKNNSSLINYSDYFKPYELVNIGYNKYISNSNNYSISIGEVTPQGMSKQTVRNITIKNNNSYFCESISKGIMSIAKRFVQDSDSIDVYKGSEVKVNSATYSLDKFDHYSIEGFEDKFGRTYARPTCYIISSKTVLSSNSEILNNNFYKVTLSLDIEKSVVRYVKQMKSVSDLSSYPIFKKIDISYILDEKLNLVESEVNEDYIVNYVINVNTHGYLKETFYPNQQLDFLNIDEDYDYEGGLNE